MAAGDPGTLKRNYTAIAVETSLSASISASTQGGSTTGFTVVSNSGFPSTYPFTLIVDPDTSKEEVVTVVSGTGTTYTVTRGQDNTQAVAHSAGSVIRHGVSAREFKELQTHIAARGYDVDSAILSGVDTHVHGIATGEGVVVGTNKAQTLTAKTISGSANTVTNIGTTSLVDGAITTAKIADGAVTTAKITDANVTTAKVADGAITSAKIADLTIATGDIADSAITSAKIADGTIVNADINASAAIAYSKLSLAGSITSNDIANDTIVDADINTTAAIAKTKISGTAVTLADTGTITSAMIADGTITNDDISGTAAIAKSKLNLGGTITSADLVDGTIVATDIADGTITAAKMVSDPYARANHTGSQAASTISDLASTVKAYRLDEFAAPNTSLSLNSQKITNLLDPTLAQDASTKAYVDAQVNALVNGAPGTLDTLGEIAAALASGGSVVSTLVAKAGDTMTGPLILNADPSNSLGAATKQYVDAVAGSASAAAASAAAAATTYDNFDDRYLGAKSSAPSVDNDGNSLLTGALYWNTVDNAMYAWSGSAWGSISSTAAIYRYRFTASGGETSVSGIDDNGLTLSYLPGKEQVYLNGVLLARTSDYTASNGSSITSLAALAASDIVEVITFTAFDVATAIPNSIFDAKGDILVGTSADTPGKLPVGTNGYYLKANSATATGLEWSQVDLSSYATTTSLQTSNEEQNIMSIMGAY